MKQLAERLGVTVEKVESVDAMLEDLSEMLRVAKDAINAHNYEIADNILNELREKSEEFGYPDILAETIILQCSLLNKLRQHEKTIILINQVIETPLFENEALKIRLIHRLGSAYENTGDMNSAIDCYKRMDEMFQRVEPETTVQLLSTLFNLVRCHVSLKNFHTGLRYAERALDLSEQHTNHLYRLRLRYMTAFILQRLGRTEEAESLYVEALLEAENNAFMEDVAIISNNYGELLFEQGEYARARLHFRRSKTTTELIRNDFYLFDSYIYLSDLDFMEGNIPSAIEYLNHVFTIVEKLGPGSYKEKARALIRLGRINNSQGEFEEYVRLVTEGIDIYEKQYMLDEAYEAAVELAEALDDRDDLRAIRYYRRAVAVKKITNGIRR